MMLRFTQDIVILADQKVERYKFFVRNKVWLRNQYQETYGHEMSWER